MKLKLSKYVIVSESLDQNEGPAGKRMIFSTRKSMGISVTNYVVNICQDSNFSELPNNLFNVLMFHEIVVPDDQEETDELLKIRGIIEEDDSEITQQLIVNLEIINNDDQVQNYLNQLIEQSNISSKTKKLNVFLQAPLVNFSLNNSNLQQVQAFFESKREFQKIHIEFNLICGIPIDISIKNEDLSWIENIYIVHLTNTNKQYFIQALSQLKMFSESVKLKMKLNIRLIFDSNFDNNIRENHELIKSIKTSILRFSLSKENFNDLDTWEKKELEFLQTLNKYDIHCVQLPEVTHKFIDQDLVYDTNFQYEYFENFVLKIRGDKSTVIYNRNLSEQEINSFKTMTPTCYSCSYLFMCGGKINKSLENNMDCPDFRSNIILKAKMKYQI